MATVKDWTDATNAFWKSSLGRLWSDEAMRPARDKFNVRMTNEFAQPLDRELKINASDYADLVRGQVTLALTKAEKPGKWFGFVLLIDSKDKAETLKTNLTELRKKWTDGGRAVRTEKVRDVEFTAYQFTQATLQKIARKMTGKPEDAAPDPEAETNKIDVLVGQSQSLLVVGTQARDLEKILAKQSGGTPPVLADQPVFQANFNALFRDATAFAWLDFKPIFELWTAPTEGAAPALPTARFANLTAQKLLPALGLGELKSIATRISVRPEGYDGELFFTVPEAARHGMVKALAPPAKDASPPPFVPADAVRFKRVRIDFQQTWAAFESALIKVDPAVAGFVQLLLGAAGKEGDANFDLKKSLIDSMGDDYISYEKAAKTNGSPSLTLLGARNPEQFLSGIRMIMRMLPEPIGTTSMSEREFLGRKIHTMNLGPGNQMLLAANGAYIAISSDPAMLEEYLRSNEAPPKPLRDLPGLADAAQKVGGQTTGWFSFHQQTETMRQRIAEAKANPDHEPPPPSMLSALNPFEDLMPDIMDWIDTPSLPPFDRIAKYFHFLLTTGSTTPDGISFKLSAPTPPALK